MSQEDSGLDKKRMRFENFINLLKDFFESKTIRYPQHGLFILELLYFFTLILVLIIVFHYKVVESSLIFGIFGVHICWIVFRFRERLKTRKDRLPVFRRQLISEWDNNDSFWRIIRFIFRSIFILTVLSAFSVLIDNSLVNSDLLERSNLFVRFILGNQNFILFILFLMVAVYEMPLRIFRKSPILFYVVVGIPLLIMSSIGIEAGLFKWGFLSIVLITLGTSLFDYEFLKQKFGIEISKNDITEKKIKYILFLPILYISLLISEMFMNSKAVRLFFINNEFPKIGDLIISAFIKILFLIFGYAVYTLFRELNLYWITKLFFSSRKMLLNGNYKKVEYNEDKKRWIVLPEVYIFTFNNECLIVKNPDGQTISYRSEKINQKLSDVIQLRDNSSKSTEYYVAFDSPILEQIDGSFADFGHRLLGNIFLGGWPIYFVIIILFGFGLIWKNGIENTYKVDGTYVRISSYVDKNDKVNYRLDWNEGIQIHDNNFYYKGELSELELSNQTFKNNHYYGNLKNNILEIHDGFSNDNTVFLRVNSNRFEIFLDRYYKNQNAETWIDVDEDGKLEQIKSKVVLKE